MRSRRKAMVPVHHERSCCGLLRFWCRSPRTKQYGPTCPGRREKQCATGKPALKTACEVLEEQGIRGDARMDRDKVALETESHSPHETPGRKARKGGHHPLGLPYCMT